VRPPVRAAGALLCLLLATTACGDDSPPSSSPPTTQATSTAPAPTDAPAPTATASGVPSTDVDQTVSVTYAGGAVTGGVQRVPVKLGSRVRLVVTSDVADEVHLHVYDLKRNVSAGRSTEILFEATIPGQVEAELEGKRATLVRLVIS
jgi:hypothetical protein